MKREQMTDKDWNLKFEYLMSQDLIELPIDYYDEELYFKDFDELNEIFTDLEEKNLYLIHMSQEVESSLETQKQDYESYKKALGAEMDLHKKNKKELEDKINEAQINL